MSSPQIFHFCVVKTIELIEITNRYRKTYKYVQIIRNENYKLIYASGQNY